MVVEDVVKGEGGKGMSGGEDSVEVEMLGQRTVTRKNA